VVQYSPNLGLGLGYKTVDGPTSPVARVAAPIVDIGTLLSDIYFRLDRGRCSTGLKVLLSTVPTKRLVEGGIDMAVVSVTTLTVKPDRYEDFLETTRKAKAILEKSGAKNVRLLAALTAGEASGSLATTWEADDFAAQGAVLDKFLADPEGLALLTSTNTTAGPTAGFQSTIWVDVPL
jgi:hypothetical protein